MCGHTIKTRPHRALRRPVVCFFALHARAIALQLGHVRGRLCRRVVRGCHRGPADQGQIPLGRRRAHEGRQTSLDEHHPPDGGHNPPLYWRRGLTVQQRNMLDDAETRSEDWDYDEQPWQYVLYYRRQPKITLRHSYLVVAVRHDKELLASLLDL